MKIAPEVIDGMLQFVTGNLAATLREELSVLNDVECYDISIKIDAHNIVIDYNVGVNGEDEFGLHHYQFVRPIDEPKG